jgi:peptidoglycan/LPS O-acetylase OafA/YrhL
VTAPNELIFRSPAVSAAASAQMDTFLSPAPIRTLIQPVYRPDIDGLRAIAVTSVVLYHADIFPFRSGFVGVDIFFVISGYLIGGIILRSALTSSFSFATFYARRARRILPALIVVILASCAAGWCLLDASEFYFVGSTSTYALLGLSNFSFWRLQDYFDTEAALHPLLMTWSLGVEEQFYFLFPFFAMTLTRVQRPRVHWLAALLGLTLASFAFGAWCTIWYPPAAFYLLPPRAWELGVGLTLAALEIHRSPFADCISRLQKKAPHNVALSGLGIIFVLVAIFGLSKNTQFPGFYALLPVLGTAALIATPQSPLNKKFLSSRPLVFVGLISYSWYLWHWPMMSYLRIVVPASPTSWQLGLVALLSFGLAVFSWRFIERPFRRAAAPTLQTLRRFAFALGLALIIPVVIKVGRGIPERLPERTTQIADIVGDRLNGTCAAESMEVEPRLTSECVHDVDGRPSIALLGDSHAWALSPGIRQISASANLGFKIYTKPGCPPLLGVSVTRATQPLATETCAAFNLNIIRRIAADESIKLIILAALWDNPVKSYVEYPALTTSSSNGLQLLRSGLERSIEALKRPGTDLIVLGDTPYFVLDPYRVALAGSLPRRRALFCLARSDCSHLLTGSAGRHYLREDPNVAEAIREVAQRAMVTHFDLMSRFCNSRSCFFQDGDALLFLDSNHVSKLGASYALRGMPMPR